jgi:hypothetical protein
MPCNVLKHAVIPHKLQLFITASVRTPIPKYFTHSFALLLFLAVSALLYVTQMFVIHGRQPLVSLMSLTRPAHITTCSWKLILILWHDRMTIDEVWIGDWIYWTLKIVTPSNSGANSISHTLQFTSHALNLLSLLYLRRLSGNGFQNRSCLWFHVQWLLSSLAGAYITTNPALLRNGLQ